MKIVMKSVFKVSALCTVCFQFCNSRKVIPSTDGARVTALAPSWCSLCLGRRTDNWHCCLRVGWSIRAIHLILGQGKRKLGLVTHSLNTL